MLLSSFANFVQLYVQYLHAMLPACRNSESLKSSSSSQYRPLLQFPSLQYGTCHWSSLSYFSHLTKRLHCIPRTLLRLFDQSCNRFESASLSTERSIKEKKGKEKDILTQESPHPPYTHTTTPHYWLQSLPPPSTSPTPHSSRPNYNYSPHQQAHTPDALHSTNPTPSASHRYVSLSPQSRLDKVRCGESWIAWRSAGRARAC